MRNEQTELAFNDAEIQNVSRRIVDKALQPQALADYILDHLDDGPTTDLLALRVAIDPRYTELRERCDRGESGDIAAELNVIDELVKFHIGVVVGQRLR